MYDSSPTISPVDTKEENGNSSQVQLRKEVGLFSAVNLIIGSMIGSGIFIAPTSALRYTKSIGLSLVVWFVCGVISLLGALSFAELGALIPKSGGEIIYIHEAFSQLDSFWGPIPSFTCSWMSILITGPAAEAVVCLTFAEYLTKPIIELEFVQPEFKELLKKLIAVLALGLTVAINIWSVKIYVKLQNTFTISKLTICVIIISCGLYQLSIGNTKNLSHIFDDSTTSPNDIVLAFYSCFWAYGGWNIVNIVAEEVKKPEVNICKSVSIGVPTVIFLYLFINISYMTVLSVPEMLHSHAVAVVFGEQILNSFKFIIPLGVACSTFGSALNGAFSHPRLMYIASQNGHMMDCLSYIHIDHLTPIPAVILHGVLSLVFILTGELTSLLELCEFLGWIFYGFVMVALIIMRRTHADQYRPFKVPILIPYFIILVSLFLAVVPIIMDPSSKYLLSIVLIGAGIVVYAPLVYFKMAPTKYLDKLTWYIQVLFKVVPTTPSCTGTCEVQETPVKE